jgi:glycosyltransferase involved in cell wall biosynthesis
MKKNILIVYPHNFFKEKSGVNTRYIELLKYFKTRNFSVDMLTLTNFKSSWENYPADRGGLINNLFFYDFKKGSRGEKQKNKKKNLWARIRKRIPFCYAYTELPDFAYKGMKKQFDEIISKQHYDYILISYVYWANLVKSKSVKKSITLLTLEDFITLNRFENSDGNIKIGNMMEEEIRRVDLFDKVICISEDEKFFFSQFALRPKYYYVPFFMKKNDDEMLRDTKPEYDIIFVGSDNPHNRKGIKWFFEKISPLLENSLRILVVGTISKHIKACHKEKNNVVCFPFVENLSEVYAKSKIAICPLLGGTGMKIKVVEALSFGKPVVSTSKGVTGFPARTNNGVLVGDSPAEFARLISKLTGNKNFYKKTARLAERFFLENFEQSKVLKKLDEVFDIPMM